MGSNLSRELDRPRTGARQRTHGALICNKFDKIVPCKIVSTKECVKESVVLEWVNECVVREWVEYTVIRKKSQG